MRHQTGGSTLDGPPPPELLEQLGIYPGSVDEPEESQERSQHAEERATANAARPTADTTIEEPLVSDIATATLSGNLTRDVELRSLPSGVQVARLRIATSARRRSEGEWVQKTKYFTIDAYGAQAHACAQHLSRGSRVIVDAELDWREWTDEHGHRRGAVTFKARRIVFEGSRGRRREPGDAPAAGFGPGGPAGPLFFCPAVDPARRVEGARRESRWPAFRAAHRLSGHSPDV
jgi:single-strand DNA-binding protein